MVVIAFLIGIALGAIAMFLIVCLCAMAADLDEREA